MRIDWVIESEADCSVLLKLAHYIRDRLLIVCPTAVLSFIQIVANIGGPREWHRALCLLSRVAILRYPPFPNSSHPVIPEVDGVKSNLLTECNSGNQSSGSDARLLTQTIFDIGNHFAALTISSNAAFLRSLQNKLYCI
ncbi:unnamed protein product [Protopolystoma xenopodis]|uniref:DUF1308 domain-containing protein n=1 Tax=Protopolystoma xenopodis TaxID=117903 RepID=A0A3S5B777_9PLAT|nr:unnamed protein product [Protopolystoma xenopodis]